MSEEKTYGQINFEAWMRGNMPWCDSLYKGEFELGAKAVIAEHLRRNGEPVAWRWKENGAVIWIYDPDTEWRLSQGNDIIAEPLYAAPQPLPTVEEIREAIKDVHQLSVIDNRTNSELWDAQAIFLLELLEGSKMKEHYGEFRHIVKSLIPNADEIDTAIRNAYVQNPDSVENMVDAVLELLKGKKWTQAQIDEIDKAADMLLSKMKPLPESE